MTCLAFSTAVPTLGTGKTGQLGVNQMGISTWVQQTGTPGCAGAGPRQRGEERDPQCRSGGVWVPLSSCKLVTSPQGGEAPEQAEPTGTGTALVPARSAESCGRNSARAHKKAKPYPKEKTQSRD